MGKILLTLVLLLGLVGYTFTYAGKPWDSITPEPTNPVYEEPCISGGPGATRCGQGASVNATFGIGADCSVTCLPPYYACCTLTGCKCRSLILVH